MSSSLTGTQIKATYGDVLQIGNSGSGITSSLQVVCDGLGNATGLQISSTSIGFAIGSSSTNNISFGIASQANIYLDGGINFVITHNANAGNFVIASLTQGVYIQSNSKYVFGVLNTGCVINSFGDVGAANVPLTVKGSSGQSTHLIDISSSGGTPLAYFGQTGWVTGPWCSRITADVPNATTTFANITDLTVNVLAGRKYVGKLMVKCNNTVASEGVKLDFNGGSATMTSFWAVSASLAGGTTVLGSAISTSLAGVINYTTITGETFLEITLSFVVNAAGTFIPRVAENSHVTGTLTAELGSFLLLDDSPN